MTSDTQFKSIRPYIGEEVPAAVERLRQAEEFLDLFSQMTGARKDIVSERLKGIATRDEFQARFFGPFVEKLLADTTDSIEVTGLEHVDKDTSYLFITNHRDINLDSAIPNIMSRRQGCH